jgi:hypothetical protein
MLTGIAPDNVLSRLADADTRTNGRLLPFACLAAATAAQERWQPMPKAPIAPRHAATLHRVGTEGDGLHLNLATGEVAVIPQGPLAPRGRPLAAIVGDRLYVLWGTVDHELFADGASYRLR